jgi:hypothetical protein
VNPPQRVRKVAHPWESFRVILARNKITMICSIDKTKGCAKSHPLGKGKTRSVFSEKNKGCANLHSLWRHLKNQVGNEKTGPIIGQKSWAQFRSLLSVDLGKRKGCANLHTLGKSKELQRFLDKDKGCATLPSIESTTKNWGGYYVTCVENHTLAFRLQPGPDPWYPC